MTSGGRLVRVPGMMPAKRSSKTMSNSCGHSTANMTITITAIATTTGIGVAEATLFIVSSIAPCWPEYVE